MPEKIIYKQKVYHFKSGDMTYVKVVEIEGGFVHFQDFFNPFSDGYAAENSFKNCARLVDHYELTVLKLRDERLTFGYTPKEDTSDYDEKLLKEWFEFKDKRETTTKTLEKFLQYRREKNLKRSLGTDFLVENLKGMGLMVDSGNIDKVLELCFQAQKIELSNIASARSSSNTEAAEYIHKMYSK